nr:MAG TPA: hypothetical protein [Caudoviricetes sp.]
MSQTDSILSVQVLNRGILDLSGSHPVHVLKTNY